MRILILLSILFTFKATAQTPAADSLQLALKNSKTDSARVIALCSLSNQFMLSDVKLAASYAHKARELAISSKNPVGQSRALNLIGYTHLILGEYDKALKNQMEALRLSEQIHDTTGLILSYLELGGVYKSTKDLKRAKQNLLQGNKLAHLINDKRSMGRIANTIGAVHEVSKEYRQAMVYYQKAAKIQEEEGDKRALAVSLLNAGNLYLFTDHPLDGLPILFRSLNLNNEVKNDMIKVPILVSIAKVYAAQKQFKDALPYAQQALEVAKKTESSKKIVAASHLLQRIHASLNQYQSAYQNLNLFTHHDSIVAEDKREKAIQEIATKYDTEKKELENQLLKKQKKEQANKILFQRVIIGLIGGLAISLLCVLFLLYRSRQRITSTFMELQKAHEQMQEQHLEINQQRNALSSQAKLLHQQNKQLTESDRFKSRVFSVISHDLRGPFASLKGILGLADKGAFKEEDVRHIFKLLDKEAEIAMNLLNNILIWSKSQLEENRLQLEEISLQQLVNENLQLIASSANQKKITIHASLPEDTIIYTDKERLNFVMRNLLANAVKFTFIGGEVRIQARQSAEQVQISVSDNGKGISAANLAKLFSEDRFTTVGTSQEKGTGLGLMLCNEFIKTLQGSLTVDSEEGKGSTFLISIPTMAVPTSKHVANLTLLEAEIGLN